MASLQSVQYLGHASRQVFMAHVPSCLWEAVAVLQLSHWQLGRHLCNLKITPA